VAQALRTYSAEVAALRALAVSRRRPTISRSIPATFHNSPTSNKFLEPLSGFKAKAVSGYVPAFVFFDLPAQSRISNDHHHSDNQTLDYLPNPTFSTTSPRHVPMHTHRLRRQCS